MAPRAHDVWLEKFDREIGIKASVILFGNTSDIIMNTLANGKYQSVMDTLIAHVKQVGYTRIIKWDRVDGIDQSVSTDLGCGSAPQQQQEKAANLYDFGDDTQDSQTQQPMYKDPGEFFPFLLDSIKTNAKKTAFILDYSDYLFGNATSLSEKERDYLATLAKSLQQGQSFNVLSNDFSELGTIVIIVTKNNATIPPAYYLNNPVVSSINVPMPGRNERYQFVEANKSMFRIEENIAGNKASMDDFVDALDGFSLKEIAQIIKLSRQNNDERMTFGKLINLFKYGEKVSPWEELSKEKLETIESRLGERVKGQDEAIKKVKNVIIRAYTGFSGLQHSSKQKKPKGTLFFVGPTGVGKTELAKALAEFVFGDEDACIRFDMSEYNHEHSDQRLVGAPPGYVGYEAGGQLTNAVKEKPFCVLLFDEIEKAHGKILDKFLQILEDGRLTDGKGETVSFSETIIIFTSNIGAASADAEADKKTVKKHFNDEVTNHFVNELQRPELMNRIGSDNIVVFNFIDDPAVLTKIAQSKFKPIRKFVEERYNANIEFVDEDAAYMAIAQKAGKKNGGRGLLNEIERRIVNPLSEYIFENSDRLAGRTIKIRLVNANFALFDFEVE